VTRTATCRRALFGAPSPLRGRTRRDAARLLPVGIGLGILGAVLAGCAGDDRPDPPDFLLNGAAAIGVGQCPNDLPESSDCPAASPSYASEVKTVIEQRCAGCHFPGNTQSSKVFADYAGIHAERRGMLTQIYGCAMPPENAVELSLEERRVLLEWFVCGALDN
jgi:hypothetical protein